MAGICLIDIYKWGLLADSWDDPPNKSILFVEILLKSCLFLGAKYFLLDPSQVRIPQKKQREEVVFSRSTDHTMLTTLFGIVDKLTLEKTGKQTVKPGKNKWLTHVYPPDP